MTILEKLWHIFIPEQRKGAVLLLFFMLVGMLLETLGVGLVVPALAIMTQSNLEEQYPFIKPLLIFLNNPTQERLVLIGMSTLIIVYAIKAAFLAFLAWKQSKFVFNLQANLSQRLYQTYLRQPYTFHLQSNSAQLIRNATTEVNQLATVTQSLLMVASELFVMLGISFLIFTVEPVGALTVFAILGVAAVMFYKATRKHVGRWGAARQYHEGMRIQNLQQGLGGIKEIKLRGCEESFCEQYSVHSNMSAHVSQRQTAFSQFPRLWLELLAISGLGGLVFTMIAQNKSMDSVLPVLGLFAAAAFRLMPSVNRVLVAIQNLKYSVPVINVLHKEVSRFSGSPMKEKFHDGAVEFENEISLRNIDFSYPGTETKSLQSVTCTIKRGEAVGIIGGSGAGKSTLVDIILGLLEPTGGEVRVDSKNIDKDIQGWQRQIGYVPQSIYLTDDSLRHNVALGLRDDDVDDATVWEAVRSARLEDFVRELPEGLDTVVGEGGVRLSGGQRQRIGIARALYHNPNVVVLDEATSALDVDTEREVMKGVKALHGKKTIIIVAHRLSTVESCDRLYRLNGGKVEAEGPPADIL